MGTRELQSPLKQTRSLVSQSLRSSKGIKYVIDSCAMCCEMRTWMCVFNEIMYVKHLALLDTSVITDVQIGVTVIKSIHRSLGRVV